MSLPYPESIARHYPQGQNPDRRRIIKCSDSKAWYAKMIGYIITVHYFCTFGAWDTEGRWLWYYDLSEPLSEIKPEVKPHGKTNWFKKIFK